MIVKSCLFQREELIERLNFPLYFNDFVPERDL
ncbi:hypothetical protein QFZ28_001155 [Neobacillus niacini]|nr:hypothetical protein [Neobacillus niacini]